MLYSRRDYDGTICHADIVFWVRISERSMVQALCYIGIRELLSAL